MVKVMKNNLSKFILAAYAALACLACAKETSANTDPSICPVDKFFAASFESVKSTYDADTKKPTWVAGDAIGVTTSSDVNVECSIVSVEEGIFNAGAITGEAPFYAVYPYSADNIFSGNVLTASVPSEQQLVAGYPVAPGALVSAAVSDSRTLPFRNCVALIAVNITRTDVKKVEIVSNAVNEYIAGQFTVDMSSSTLDVEPVPANASQIVTLLPADETFAAGVYYVSVIPGTISDCSIKFTTDSDTKEFSVPGSVDFRRSAGVNFGKVFVRDIATKEQFKIWASKASTDFTSWDVVNLMADIDMTGEDFAEVKNFVGEFNGNDHTIKGLCAPLFENVYGYIHNLILDCDITASAITGNDYGYGMLAHYSYLDASKNAAAKISNVTTKGSLTVTSSVSKAHNLYVGGLVGCSNGSQLIDCVNEASISNASVVTSGNHSTGGVAGGYQSASGTTTLSPVNCVNKGTVLSTGSSQNHGFVGGCFGFINTPIELSSCTNEGIVSNNMVKAGALETGGVLGYFYDKLGKANVKGCKNTGAVKDESTHTSKVGHYVGGVVGRIEGSAPAAANPLVAKIELEGCVNEGVVTMNPATASTARAGGIMGTCTNYVAFRGCINKGSVVSTCAPGDLQLAGMLAMIEKGATFADCENHGEIKNAGAATSSVRIGGFSGNSNNPGNPVSGATAPFISLVDCQNTGNVSNNSSSTVQVRAGGLLGSAAVFSIKSSTNTGNVSSITTSGTMSRIMMAGLVGCSTGGTSYTNTIEGCANNCAVSYSGTISTNDSAMLVGYTDINMLYLTNNKVKGSFNGTEITADNYSSYLWKTGTKVTSSGNTYGE